MSRLIKRWIPILIATITGLVVLAGYLVPSPLSTYYRDVLVEWAVIVAAFAFILGLFNILRVHGARLVRLRQGWPYSLVLLLVALVAWLPPLLYGPSGTPTQQMLDYVIGPLGASLAALVVFTLALAAFRLLRVRRSVGAVFFVLIVAAILLGSAPFTGLEWLAGIRDWIVNVPGMAGMRGLLLGVALGTVITALRLFVASDRPHSEF
nr:hypothetical protein [Anaerolineae bacterium]